MTRVNNKDGGKKKGKKKRNQSMLKTYPNQNPGLDDVLAGAWQNLPLTLMVEDQFLRKGGKFGHNDKKECTAK